MVGPLAIFGTSLNLGGLNIIFEALFACHVYPPMDFYLHVHLMGFRFGFQFKATHNFFFFLGV